MAETFTIGVSSVERPDVLPDYASIALWQVYRRQNVSNNAVDDELQLLSGVHTGAALMSFWPTTTEELTIKVLIQPHSSTIHHNGNWDGEVCLSGGVQYWKTKFNDVDVTYRDIVLKETQVYFEMFENYHGDTSWWFSSVHSGNLTFDRCLIHTKGGGHTRTRWWSYEPQVSPSAFGTFEANYNNCVLEDTVGPVYPANGSILFYPPEYSHHTYNFKGCTLSKQSFLYAQAVTNYAPSASLTVNLSGCIEDTSSAAQPTLIAGHPINLGYYPGGVGFPSGLSATIVDHITNEDSGSVYDWAQTKTNVSYGVPFNYDGTVTAGEVNFVDNAGASSFRDYRLVADLDNLPVQYFTSNRGTISDGHTAVTYRDITNNLRPGDSDAGAYQSIDTSVSSFEIGASSLGHAKDGDYATVVLWHNDNRSKFLNETTHELTLLDGEHDMPSTWFYQDNRVSHKVKVKGETSHQGYWTSGTSFNMGYVGYINNSDGTLNQSVSWSFEDLVINHSAWILRARIPYYETVEKDYVFGLELNNCLVSSTIYSDGVLVDISNLRKSEITLTNNVFNLNAYTISQPSRASVIVRGNTFRSPNNIGTFIQGVGDSTGVIEGNLYEGPTNRQFVTGFDSGLTLRDNIIKAPSIPTFSNVTGPLVLANNTVGASFNYDGTVTSGEVCFVGSANSSDLDFRLVSDNNNLAVQYVEILDELPGRDVTGYRKPRLSDAGAYQSISTSSTVHYVGTSSVTFTPDYASLSLWHSETSNDPILNGMDRIVVLGNEVFGLNAQVGTYRTDGLRRVHHSITLSGLSSQDGELDTGTVVNITDSNFGQYANTLVFVDAASPTDITFNIHNLVVSSTYSYNTFSLVYTRGANAYFPGYNTSSNYGAYNLHTNFKNCILISDDSYLLAPTRHQSSLFVLDPDANLSNVTFRDFIEIGSLDTTYTNCVIIGNRNSYGREDTNGTVGISLMYIPNTTYGSSATITVEGCTCINTIALENRIFITDYDFKGSVFYNDHTVLTVNGWNNLIFHKEYTQQFQQQQNYSSIPLYRSSISKLEDCIFSHASAFISFQNNNDNLPLPASSFTNCSFAKYFDFNGIPKAGRVAFENNYVSSTAASYDFLDNFLGASVAYSLRKLSQSYTGYCIKVRRSSDNSEIDVGFDSNGDLNTSAIINHCGAASGYVSVWYDQTSNSVDATQSVSASQPLIYDGVNIITENNKPALSFHESRDTRLTFDTDLLDGAYVDLLMVLAVDLDGVYGTDHLASEGNGANLYWHTGGRRSRFYVADRFIVQGSAEDRYGINMQTERQCILELWSEPTKARQRINNIQRNATQNRAPVTIPSGERSYTIGARPGSTLYNMNGRYQEFIIFPEDQDTSRNDIFDNLNNHYEASPLYFTPRNQ